MSDEEIDIPVGDRYPLNSRNLKAVWIQRIAQSLELPTAASTSEIRQMIEGKLGDLQYEATNIQVVIQGKADESIIFLIDDSGIIKSIEPINAHHSHVISDDTSSVSGAPPAQNESPGVEEQIVALTSELEQATNKILSLESELVAASKEIISLKGALDKQQLKVKRLWRENCDLQLKHEEEIELKDREIEALRTRVHRSSRVPTQLSMENLSISSYDSDESSMYTDNREHHPSHQVAARPSSRKGKAPPVDSFASEGSDLLFEEWLPAFERMALWNEWTGPEKLIQLAGYLRGKALQEWLLLGRTDRSTYAKATAALKEKLDPSRKTLATQDFRHLAQGRNEAVADFILRLEQTFRRAYGFDKVGEETRHTLLHGQLQEGLKYSLMSAPAVSGAQTYAELCMAAKNEERRQSELVKRQHYQFKGAYPDSLPRERDRSSQQKQAYHQLTQNIPISQPQRRCYICNGTDHLAKSCKTYKSESKGSIPVDQKKPSGAKKVIGDHSKDSQRGNAPALMDLLFSDSDDEVKAIRIRDDGSSPKCVPVLVQGVPAYGIVDTAADITIMGGRLFRKVASVARLKKRNLKPSDKTPRNYDQRPFKLDGRMELTITFGEKEMSTQVYIKLDAADQLLLSEGVCRLLDIVTYHTAVEKWRGGNKSKKPVTDLTTQPAVVPIVKVSVIKAVRVLPHQSVVVPVEVTGTENTDATWLVEPDNALGVEVEQSALSLCDSKNSHVIVSNTTGYTQTLEPHTKLGTVVQCNEVMPTQNPDSEQISEGPAVVKTVTTQEGLEWRTTQLRVVIDRDDSPLDTLQKDELHSLLSEYHQTFSLEEDERGETDIVQLIIDTGDAPPQKQPVRRVPVAARQELANLLQSMQKSKIIQPSNSPWASPVVLVRKKDGSLRLCIDYRKLNSVTKCDAFPMPRIDDLLDVLGQSKYFTTLDLKSGYWQVKVHPDSCEKTAFITHGGLYEFRVMPFGLANAPALFQRLMQRVLGDLNEDQMFVSIYLDDILIFSRTFEEHKIHLREVLKRLQTVGLKLNPAKCYFVRTQVHYLGHIITAEGIKPTTSHIEAIKEFAVPKDVKALRQFLGLSSFYRRFVPNFAKLADPLHKLTRKNEAFVWSPPCQEAFDCLKSKLVESPVLAYPDFQKDFSLETDASGQGLGAILSQTQSDGKRHPVAYASRALSMTERRYAVTELETLAVVWAMSHFHHYLYGHNVVILTDHSAVKAVLGSPSKNGQHARWWTKVFGSGVKDVQIGHRAGRENSHADALSRQPHLPPPDEGISEGEVQVCAIVGNIDGEETIESLLQSTVSEDMKSDEFSDIQRNDKDLKPIITYLEEKCLPNSETEARRVMSLVPVMTIENRILYYIDCKQKNMKRTVVPQQLQQQIMTYYHSSIMAGHFSGVRLYKTLSKRWYWEGMYGDCLAHSKSCPQCAISQGTGKKIVPPLNPIPISRVFQIVGVDIMELPKTRSGNKYVVVFQDFLSKWPMVFPVADQKAITLAKLLVEQVIPFMGVPEALLSDRGTNLLSNLMLDVCQLLGVKKLNTTAYHPQCNGLVERFNRTLKAMLRKQAATYGLQWDKYLSGVVWAYRNTPHETTGEKPSFLLFGTDCRSPTEAALLPPTDIDPVDDLSDYRQEMIVSLATARVDAAESIRKAQKHYKKQHDKQAHQVKLKLGDWVLVYFPKDDTGRNRKLSRPWHGPYRVLQIRDPDVTVCKVYFPEHGNIQVHQRRIQQCPMEFPAGYFWYGGRSVGPGQPPEWVERLLAENLSPGISNQTQTNIDMTLDNHTEPSENCDENEEYISDGVDDEQEQVIESDEQEQTDISSEVDTQDAPRQHRTRTRIVVPPIRYRS